MDKTEREVSGHDDIVEGTVSAGRGDLANVEMLAELLRGFHARYCNLHISRSRSRRQTIRENETPGACRAFPCAGSLLFQNFFLNILNFYCVSAHSMYNVLV